MSTIYTWVHDVPPNEVQRVLLEHESCTLVEMHQRTDSAYAEHFTNRDDHPAISTEYRVVYDILFKQVTYTMHTP